MLVVMAATIHLRSCRRRTDQGTAFPFSVPAIATLREIEFTSPVTFFVGENGSGKSTLLEAMAINAQLLAIGSRDTTDDPTLAAVQPLADDLLLRWHRHPRRGFFLRAEDYFAFTARNRQTMAELVELAALDAPDPVSDQVRRYRAELAEWRTRYGGDLDHRSHGESFLQLFQARIVPRGLYLMDEPEAALSPQRQLAFLSLLKLSVEQGSQFVIATHAPILMSFPQAVLLQFDTERVAPVAFGDVEHVRLTRDFLRAPEHFLRHL